MRLAKVVNLKAVAHLENEQVDLAKKDYLDSIKFVHPWLNYPLLINYLVVKASFSVNDSILWEGFQRHAWNDAQLREMEAALAADDFLASGAKALRLERGYNLNMINLVEAWGPDINERSSVDERITFYIFHLRPRGWWDQDRCASSLMMQKQINAIDVNQAIVQQVLMPHPSYFEQIYLPLTYIVSSNHSSNPNIAKAETHRRLARLACRLEEYYLVHHQYPSS